MTKPSETVSLKVNGKTVVVPKNSTVLQACQQAEVEVPVFCYHPKLSVAGNCRMCLVQIGESPKPVASCAMPVCDDMEVSTTSDLVQNARKGVLEFLLINHPLDCPICDQGGECDLQDLSMGYGCGKSRYKEAKRAVPNPDLGPLIKTVMNRCIHCMRCVRFGDGIAGVSELGALDRGEHAVVTTSVGQTVRSELSGNMIDLCPVGALTAKPYAFEGRAWEFKHTESIGVHDAVGSAIRIDTRAGEVMRVLPRVNEAVNEEWICDKTRFSFDGLKRQRLDRCYVRTYGKLLPQAFDNAVSEVMKLLQNTQPDKIGILAGPLVDVESLFAFQHFAEMFSISHLDCRLKESFSPLHASGDFVFNTPIAALEKADVCLIIGANMRFEASMVNMRLRKAVVKSGLQVGVIGDPVDLTFDYDHIGSDFSLLNTFEVEEHPFVEALKSAKNPVIIVGGAIEEHPEAEAIYGQSLRLAEIFNVNREGWHGFNYLSLEASRVGALDLGFYRKESPQISTLLKENSLELLISLGADGLDPGLSENTTVIYLGHHGDQGAQQADIILPTAAFHEKEGTYVNLEGRSQIAYQAVDPVGDALPEWKWVNCFLKEAGHPSFESFQDLREILYENYPHLKTDVVRKRALSNAKKYTQKQIPEGTEIHSPIKNFYRTDVISRASETMAKCTESFLSSSKGIGGHDE